MSESSPGDEDVSPAFNCKQVPRLTLSHITARKTSAVCSAQVGDYCPSKAGSYPGKKGDWARMLGVKFVCSAAVSGLPSCCLSGSGQILKIPETGNYNIVIALKVSYSIVP